jgi:polyhydroxyalkanoate synthesis repressor PhaR
MSISETSPPRPAKAEQSPVVVKKYANRRLYNTESSSYITLDNLAGMIRAGRDFVVYDAKTGEDITRGVLTQIIVEEESKGRAMLPTAFLRQIIGFYGDSLQQFVPSYLEQAMTSFAQQQEQMRTTVEATMGNLFPGMHDIGRQNMAMMERAMSLFAPFYRNGEGKAAADGTIPDMASAPGEMAAMQSEIDMLRAQLAAARANPAAPHEAEAPLATAGETDPV